MIIFNLILSSFLSLILYPYVKSKGLKYNLTDLPNERKVHDFAKVNIGGVSIFLSFNLTLLLLWFVSFSGFIDNPFTKSIIHILISAAIIFFLGLLDDLFTLSPFLRLGILISLASFSWKSEVLNIPINFNLSLIDIVTFNNSKEILSFCITIFLVVGLINAINWIDGLDGLATGTLFINFITLTLTSAYFNQNDIVLIISPIIGSLFITLFYNFKPAKIFIGDCGAYFLGYILISFSILIFKEYYLIKNPGYDIFDFSPLIAIVSLPLVDMIFVIIERISKFKSPFYPDKNHLHHILLDKGISYSKIISLYYSITFIFSLVAVIMIKYGLNLFTIGIYLVPISILILMRSNINLKILQ